ncbi:RNA methyltransferase [Candidatus Marinamargulisbacteria bacterium SCGC AG-414-C22]|nr:RNA methyltransferase [Candidatus Marinamargulisbacteria bacterium SCGC AG-414-C22]
MKLRLIASTTMGFEALLKQELIKLNMENVQAFNGKVEFDGDLTDVTRANLWLRTAGRVYIKIAEFKATTFDELYEQTTQLNWKRWIQQDDHFPITKISSKKSILFSKSDSQAIIKKAIVNNLLKSYKTQRLSEDSGATVAVRVQIENDIVTLSIDTTGSSLSNRGYRAHMSKAPLRETLAAGLVMLSRWRPAKDALFDPFCGSGTILIEAALMAKNQAPGLFRRFAAQEWACIPKKIWDTTIEKAREAIITNPDCNISGSDKEGHVIGIANKNAHLVDCSFINFETRSLQDCTATDQKGVIITNPPYGERLAEQADIDILYKHMGDIIRSQFIDWNCYILSANERFELAYGKPARKNRKLYNGGLKSYLYQYF